MTWTPPEPTIWVDESTGLTCEAAQTDMGTWCGYVHLPAPMPAQPERGKDDYGTYLAEVLDCHGGVTFEDAEKIGFDCAHLSDYNPHFFLPKGHELRRPPQPGERVWTEEMVRREVEFLATQIFLLADGDLGALARVRKEKP